MRKKTKKLVLARETVRKLSEELRGVRGGDTANPTTGTLQYSDPGVCGGNATFYNSCQRFCQQEPISYDLNC